MSNIRNSIQMLAKVSLLIAVAAGLNSCDSKSKDVTATNKTTPTAPIETPSPATPPVKGISVQRLTRIFCEPIGYGGVQELFSLTSLAEAEFNPLKINFYDEAGSLLTHIDSFKLLQSDGKVGYAVIGIKDPMTKSLKIYSTEVDYQSGKAAAIMITQTTRIPLSLEVTLERLGHNTSYFGISREHSYVLIPDRRYYSLRDMRTFNVLTRIHVDPAKYFNPVLSENGRYVFFTTMPKDNLIQQVQVSLITGKLTILPFTSKTDVQLVPRWVDDGESLIWLEQQGSNKVIYTATQDELILGKAKSLVVLRSLPETAVSFFIKKGILNVAWNEETSPSDANAVKTLESGVLKITTYDLKSSSPATATDIKTYPYSEEILKLSPQVITGSKFIQALTYSPWTEELYGSLNSYKGIVSFDINTEKWKLHSTRDAAFSCTKPILGPELILETM